MYKIELQIPRVMSLLVNSSAGSEDLPEEELQDNEALAMSDEEFDKLSIEDFNTGIEEDDEDEEIEEEEDEDLGDESDEDDESEEVNEEEPTTVANDDGSEQTEDEEESEGDQPNEKELPTDADKEAYQKAFELLYGNPIKASGREVQIRNPEHARNFIEMGIDYNKKMHSMKPHLRTLKTLEKEGLLDAGKEERLNLLLEVEKGNKDALKRLIAESGIDPLDFADDDVIERGKEYRPQNHLISDHEVEIEEALKSIDDSPSQQRTLDVMTKQFDAKSRQLISENPRYIVALNNDIDSGIYDKVQDTIQYKRDMRQVPSDMSDIELYIQTVNELADIEEQNQTPVAGEKTKPTNKPNRETRRRRVGMSGSKSSRKPKKKEYDPMEVLSMDDEKFMKEMGMDNL